MPKEPNSKVNLIKAISRYCANPQKEAETQLLVAEVALAQMLPSSVIKGGTSLKLRYGIESTRYTVDFDAARKIEIEQFETELTENLRKGWGKFSGLLVREDQRELESVPHEYLMQPYRVRLMYNSSPWRTIDLEVGHNEIGDAEEFDLVLKPGVKEIFKALGLPEPQPFRVMKIEYQVAQKLHAVSTLNSHRAHDLIDLQLLVRDEAFDLVKTRKCCERLFAYRKMQSWPVNVNLGADWAQLYDAQLSNLDVLPDVEQAVEWCNELIRKISKA